MFKSNALRAALCLGFAALIGIGAAHAETASVPEKASDFIAHNFHFSDGAVLPEVRIHYVTIGTPKRDAQGQIVNGVLLMHGTTGTSQEFLTPLMRNELFAPGQPLDAQRYFVVIPDGLGRGGSSKPSDGMGNAFPHYGYNDVVEANHQMLVDGLHLTHLRLVLGVSMGGMQTWIWGERYPDMADALMPIVSQPIAIAGRNWLWRQMVISAIRNDPDWHNGAYTTQPTQWRRMMPIFSVLTVNPARLQEQAPTRQAATDLYDNLVQQASKNDANDVLYWFESAKDYDPSAQLSKIRAKVLAVNFADDLLNATDLGVMQRLIPLVPKGRFVEVPESDQSYGHQTQTHPEKWKSYLAQLLNEH